MKKYIIPATKCVALQTETYLMLSNHDEVTDPGQYPQLAPSNGWSSDNWTENDEPEE